MEPRDVIVLSPPGTTDPCPAIAAGRTAAMGVLDLEFRPDPIAAQVARDRLIKFTPAGYGILIRTDRARLIDLLLTGKTPPARVILTAGDSPELRKQVDRLRAGQIEVLLEAVSLHEAILGVEAGVHGIILKGHEAGGRVGTDTSFVLVQKWCQYVGRQGLNLPFWVRGGIGPNTAAACLVAGARGVVLDSQVLLARESPLLPESRKRLTSLDGSETTVLGLALGEGYRIYARPDSRAAEELAQEEQRLLCADLPKEHKLRAWREAVDSRVSCDPSTGVWPVGQDVALAVGLAAVGQTVAGIIDTICDHATHQSAAARLGHLAEGSPLAQSHGTRYPILQGPMTRVSDTPGFAAAVAAGGALPFLALALLRKSEVDNLLKQTRAALGSRPWGVGILGFVPPEIRAEQFEAIRTHKPPFAIIAGGRPDQAKELEAHGIATYIHVPSPGLLRMFLKDGARRFIFEGHECGGHVGPRTSFALWEAMIGVLTEHLGSRPGDDLHIVFAGGIHDQLSTGMVAALSAGLAQKGVKIGVLLGTAYLFTKEAVEAGAITVRFQQEALACDDTVLLETGPGHAIRCIPTPYAETFEAEKRRLQDEGKPPREVGLALERMNLGRLRVASKGLDRRVGLADNGTGLVAIPDDEQYRRGMYMIGQIAALRNTVTTIAQLHADVCAGAVAERLHVQLATTSEPPAPPPCDVAIIGLSCFYPGAGGLWPYWENILAKVNAVTEIPPTHWDWRAYYDPDPRARDKMVSKWGGFLGDVVFDPLQYGITPKSIPNIEPLQLLLLEAVNQAIGDAGYYNRPFARERTCAIVGIGGGGMPLSVAYGFRACMPLVDSIPGVPIKSQQIIDLGQGILPEWTEDSFPGILLNVAAGRVANRFNLGGPNMAIDAACGSSLAALYAGVRELNNGTSDVAIVMGADTVQTPYAYVAFSKTHALSPRGRCRPFDAGADGIALAEGIGVAVLKRLADAERDGDRIYAVIKGIGASSDGRDKGLTAPRAEGQLRALRRAYAQARLSPARVGLVEAHGTGTVVGDQTEARAIGDLFREAGGAAQACALGSVKSMIGHSKCAAGLAGIIKAAFALYHKVLPPTLVEVPNPKANLDGGPLYLNTEARPWVHGANHPRTAGVSAFGFGGTNFHTVLEEYTGDYLDRPEAGLRHWPAELFVWRRPDVGSLIASVKHCRDALAAGAAPTPSDLAASLWQNSKGIPTGSPVLAVVAASLDDLKQKLDAALELLPKSGNTLTDPRGIYYAVKPAVDGGKVAFLFPGQGSQYPDMLAQQAIAFPEVRTVLDRAEQTIAGELDRPLGKFIYPPSAFTPEQEARNRRELQRTEVAQPAVGAASLGLFQLLTALGVEPDFLAGHSYGEYVALAAAGSMSEVDLIRLSYRRGQVIRDAATTGGMLAANTSPDVLAKILDGTTDVWVANQNSPQQTVLAGTEPGLKVALEKLRAAGVRAQPLEVACGFHSPLVAAAREPLAHEISLIKFAPPRKPVFSNTTATTYGPDPAAIAQQLTDHLVSPVRFADQIVAMYEAGARVFVEVGPQAILTGLTGQTLAGRPHLAVATDVKGRPGLVQLAHTLGQLLVAGLAVRLDRLFDGRGVTLLELAKLGPETGKPKHPPTAWVVNGVRSRPIHAPEPRLLGHPLPPSGDRSQPVEANKPQPAPTSPLASSRPTTPQVKMHTPEHAPPVTPVTSPSRTSTTDGAAQVMMRFQEVMARFLDTQRSVMLSFLGSSGSPPTPTVNGHIAQPLNGKGHITPSTVTNRLTPTEPRPATATAPIVNGQMTVQPVAPSSTSQSHEANGKHEAVQQPSASGPIDRDTLLARLLDLVSERTGYPKEAISIDLDLEADLGIDSIKRVEILGALAESLEASAGGQPPNLEMEKLSVIKTLRGIADYAMAAIGTPSPQPSINGQTTTKHELHPGARAGEVQRLVVQLIDAPLPLRPRFTPPTGTILITDDENGVARELAERLAALDVNTVLVRMANSDNDKTSFATDLTDPAAVEELLVRIRQQSGPVAGLIHLLPLAPSAERPVESMVRRDVKSLYLLARGLETDIRSAGKAGGGVLLVTTGMGGTIGFGKLSDDFRPGHGGVAGFTKCLGYEWPEATVRVVDVDPAVSPDRLADLLLSELGDPDGPFEVGHTPERRVTCQVEPGPLDKQSISIELSADSTVLITGGARGITARVALELATRYQPHLVLVGSSPEPAEEAPDTVGLTTPAELKAALLKRQPDAKPAAIEAAYRRLLKDREIRSNLAAIRAAGSTVEYRTVDVRNQAALEALIDELNAGGITGVIHGAGVIEDKLLRDKTPESFERVFGTKVDSVLTLARKLKPNTLKFFAVFASLTSRFGNRGQSDYAAANEVLSKLAADLDRKWPGRVVSLAWGPWAEVGMVAELEKHLVARGLKLIEPAVGATFAVDELVYGVKGEPEVIIAGGTEQAARPGQPALATVGVE